MSEAISGGKEDDNVFIENESDIAIIREIFDGAHELFENELERALEAGCETIVIEPNRLGEETARWISIGHCLRKTALVTGFGAVVSGVHWPNKPLSYCSLATLSVLASGVHALSWQFDACNQYEVDSDPLKTQSLLNLHSSDSPKPIVLSKLPSAQVKRNNLFHAAISLIALAFSAWKFYKCWKFTLVWNND